MSPPPSTAPAGPVALWEIAKALLTGSGGRSSTVRALVISIVGAGVSFLGQIVLAHSLAMARTVRNLLAVDLVLRAAVARTAPWWWIATMVVYDVAVVLPRTFRLYDPYTHKLCLALGMPDMENPNGKEP